MTENVCVHMSVYVRAKYYLQFHEPSRYVKGLILDLEFVYKVHMFQ